MDAHSLYLSDQGPKKITIEYSARFQIPSFQILGLPGPEIQEARERIVAAFQNSELEFPKKKVIINLAPASVRKSGTGHDLAIAIKILSEMASPPQGTSTPNGIWPESILAWGELSLDGTVRSSGFVGHLIELLLSREEIPYPTTLILGPGDYHEYLRLLYWRKSKGLPVPRPGDVMKITSLKDLIDQMNQKLNQRRSAPENRSTHSELNSDAALAPLSLDPLNYPLNPPQLLPLNPFQERIVKLGSIGRHHILVLGPKGVGKSASFDWFKALALDPTTAQAWENALYQESRRERPEFKTPIRHVHSQVRPAHLIGSFGSGGYRAGELSLSHGGILFADEFPEWPRDSKECLREPLQTEHLNLTRVRGMVKAKCDLQLIASGNLCPCGGFPALLRSYGYQSKLNCRCSEPEIRGYLQKISGPILDRIDLVTLFTEPVKTDFALFRPVDEIKREILNAREFALKRFKMIPARIPPEDLEASLAKKSSFEKILESTGSLRSRHKIIRVAKTIQALELATELREEHLIESRSYRFMDSMI